MSSTRHVSSKIRTTTSSTELFHAFILFSSRSIRWNVPRLSEEPTRISQEFSYFVHAVPRIPPRYFEVPVRDTLFMSIWKAFLRLLSIIRILSNNVRIHVYRVLDRFYGSCTRVQNQSKSKQICLQYVF